MPFFRYKIWTQNRLLKIHLLRKNIPNYMEIFLLIATARRELTEHFLTYMFPSLSQRTQRTVLIAQKCHPELQQKFLHYESAKGTQEFEYRGLMLSKKFVFSHVIAFNEKDILIAARLRSYLKIPGAGYKDALIWRDKIVMRERLQPSIHVSRFKEVYSITDVLENLEYIGYPFVLKPKRRGGAEGVIVVCKEKDLSDTLQAFSEFHETGVVMEEWIDGDLFQVDGYYYEGHVVAWPSAENPGTEIGIRTLALLPYDHLYVNPILQYTEKIMQEICSFNTVFHLELFRAKDGKIVFLETACRFSGAGLVDLWRAAFGINLSDIHYQLQVGIAPEGMKLPKLKETYGSFEYRPKNAALKKIPDMSKVPHLASIINLDFNAKPNTNYNLSVTPNGAFCSGMIVSDSYETWFKKCKEVIDFLENNFIWE